VAILKVILLFGMQILEH